MNINLPQTTFTLKVEGSDTEIEMDVIDLNDTIANAQADHEEEVEWVAAVSQSLLQKYNLKLSPGQVRLLSSQVVKKAQVLLEQLSQ